MHQYSTKTDLMIDELQDQTVALQSEYFKQAVELSNRLPTEDSRWKTYLNWLMLFGFQAWLNQRAPDLDLQFQDCSITNPPIANVLDAVCSVTIGSFKICLLRLERGDTETTTVPRAVIDLPEFAAHFYVLIDVLEEQEEIIIHSILGYDHLTERQRSHRLQPQRDWTYTIPLTWFNPKLAHFIVALRCGDVYQASLPEVPVRLSLLSHQWAEFTTVLSCSVRSQQSIWTEMTWEQGIKVLTNSDLVNWFYEEQGQGLPESSSYKAVGQPGNPLNQTIINTWNWMYNTLDEVSQSLGWVMQPALTLADGLRGDAVPGALRLGGTSYQTVIAALNKRGIQIPNHDYNACLDLELGTERLRLRAIPIPALPPEDSQEPVSEWRLLIILDSQSGSTLPRGMALQVSDQNEVLNEQVFDQEEDACMVTCVVGGCDEQFTVTIKLADGLSLTLPAFTFQPGEES